MGTIGTRRVSTASVDKRQAGYTFIEILIVLVVMTIACVLAVDRFIKYMRTTTLSAVTMQVVGELTTAQSLARSRSMTIGVKFYSGGSYHLFKDINANGDEDSQEELQSKSIEAAYRNVTVSSGTVVPLFYSNGTARVTTVTISSSAGTKTIQINIAGRIKIL